jgi:spore germination protein YaaH
MLSIPAVRVRRRALHVVVAALTVIGSGLLAASAPAASAPTPVRVVSGWVPYWNPQSGPASIRSMRGVAGSVSLFSYSVRGATEIGRTTTLDRKGTMRAAARAAHIPIVPTLADATAKGVLAGILTDPVQRAAHIAAIVSLVQQGNFDGIDLDYEGFAFADGSASWPTTKPVWTLFVTELGAALHDRAKLLFVTIPAVYAPTDERGSGYWVYNPVGVAPSVDRIRFMAYDYSTSRVGPNAPLAWTQRIVDFAAANLPVGKVELGVPLYGRDWITGSVGTCPAGVATSGHSTVRTARATALATSKGAVPQRQVNGEMMFTYASSYSAAAGGGTTTTTIDPASTLPTGTDPSITDPSSSSPTTVAPPTTTPTPSTCAVNHTVWYPDAGTTVLKLQQALAKGLAGIALFAFGYEESTHFDLLKPIAAALPHPAGVDPIGDWTLASPVGGSVQISGWALDPETSLPIVVQVSVDGSIRKSVLANGRRDDVAATWSGNGPYHGADITVPVRKGRHRICVIAKGVGAGTTSKRLVCRTLRIAAPPLA